MKDLKNIKLNIDLSKIKKSNKQTDWLRAIYFSLIISVVIFGSVCIYLFFKPASENIKSSIDSNISEANIIFPQDVLEMVKKRQAPK